MTKSKHQGPALFDLLGGTRDEVDASLRPPLGAASSPPPLPKATRRPESEQAIVPSRAVVAVREASSVEPGSGGTGCVRRRRRLLEFDDECVTLSLTSLSAAIVVFFLSVGLLGLYELGRTRGASSEYQRGHRAGRASYAADATSEIEAARNAPPASHVVEGLLETASAGASVAAEVDNGSRTSPQTPWVRGLTYVVAQEFAPQAEPDARKAQAFLRSQGIDTALIKQDNHWFQLVTTQGYDRSDSVQRNLADKFLAKEHAAGAAFYASGGGYRLEGYFKTLRNERW